MRILCSRKLTSGKETKMSRFIWFGRLLWHLGRFQSCWLAFRIGYENLSSAEFVCYAMQERGIG